MERNVVGWFEIYVDDMERAKVFYETVFACKLEVLEAPVPGLEMFTFPMTEGDTQGPGAGGALCKMEGVQAGGNSIMVYFSSEDCAIEEARIAEAGGTVIFGKRSLGEYGNIVVLQDTEGNTVGIHSMQ